MRFHGVKNKMREQSAPLLKILMKNLFYSAQFRMEF